MTPLPCPSRARQLTVTAGSPADGCTIDELTALPGGARVSFIVRDGQLVPIKNGIRPRGDVLVLAGPVLRDKLPGPHGALPDVTPAPGSSTAGCLRALTDPAAA